MLVNFAFTHAFASDLGRAYETARIIAAPHGIEVASDPRLREFDFGQWEGLTWAQIAQRWPEFEDQSYTAARLYRPVGGESFEDVVARARSFFDELRATSFERVLIVTHAGFLHAAIAALEPSLPEVDPLSLSFSTASLTRIAMDENRARLITLNDVTHLDPTG